MNFKKVLLLTLAPLMLASCGATNTWARKMGVHPGFYDESLVANEMTKSGTTYYVIDIKTSVNGDTNDLVVVPSDFTADGTAAVYFATDYAVPGKTETPELTDQLTTYTFSGKDTGEMGGILVCFTNKVTNSSTIKYKSFTLPNAGDLVTIL